MAWGTTPAATVEEPYKICLSVSELTTTKSNKSSGLKKRMWCHTGCCTTPHPPNTHIHRETQINPAVNGLAIYCYSIIQRMQAHRSFYTQLLSSVLFCTQEIHRMNEELEKPAGLVPSGEEIAQLEKAQAMASEVTSTVLSQRLELDEKARTVSMLQKALVGQKMDPTVCPHPRRFSACCSHTVEPLIRDHPCF